MGPLQTPAEIKFRAYSEEIGLEVDYEPDWNAEFCGDFRKNPDFLARPSPAIFEVREFKTQAETRFHEENSLWNGATPSTVMRKPLYYALKDKASQLEEFSATGVPLVIVLSNPRNAEIDLGSSEITATMFGTPTSSAFGIWSVESILGGTTATHEPGYGVFCGTDSDGQPLNRRSHISGVAVLDQGVTYYDLAGYWLGSGPPIPDDWFTGPHDRRFGFADDGIGFGPKPLLTD